MTHSLTHFVGRSRGLYESNSHNQNFESVDSFFTIIGNKRVEGTPTGRCDKVGGR